MNAERPPLMPPPQEELVDLPQLWRTINHYKARVLAITLLAAAAGVLAAFSIEPRYQATITVLIQPKAERVVGIQDVYDPGYGTTEYLATQAALLKSEELAGRVVDRLDLASNELILPKASTEPSLASRLASLDWLPFLPQPDPTADVAPLPEVQRERATGVVVQNLTVAPVYRTQLVRATFESPSPLLAAKVVNTLGDLFVESGLEARLDATERTTRWLTDRLSELRAKLEDSERALQAFRDQNQLVNVGGTRGLFEEDLLDNSRKLREAQRKKTELASTYWRIKQAGDDDQQLQDVSALLLDPLVQRTSNELAEAQQAVRQLEERYGAKHPQMATAAARLRQAQASYLSQLRLAANGVKAEYEIAAETERALIGVVQAGKARIQRLDQSDHALRILEREALANRELYETFLKRFKETDTTSTLDTANARLVDRATVPRKPVKPDKVMVVLFWMAGGLILGIVLAVIRHLLMETVRSPEHLEQATQLSVVSVLPPVPGLGRKTTAPALCLEHPRAPFSEGVRSIRTSLMLSDVDKRMKRVMVTSALPKEGKSSIASSFAAVLGQTERVVLVEADLRAPTLKRVFGIARDAPGLAEVLTGQATLEQALFRHAASGVDVLPVGQVPPNPAEVIASAAFSRLMDTLCERYDRVIFDTPPCQVASDSLLLAHRMDAVLFVIHGARTGVRAIQTAVKHLRQAHAPLLGHVLNQVDARKAYGYEGSYYVYGSYGPT